MRPKILNSKGEEILLNDREQKLANYLQRQVNDLGYEIDITTLTTISKKITEQKFFQIAPAEFMPIRVGEGAWSSTLTTYRSYENGGDFADGVINTGNNNGRLASADAAVDAVPVKIENWAKSVGWTLFDLQQASKSGNWDLITGKQKSRKKNWDLGIQKVAFLGLAGSTSCLGLLNQAGVTNNLTRITQAISSLAPIDLKALLGGILDDYRTNCNRTAWPTHFVMPESDYLGLAAPASADFPIKVTLELLEDMFKIMTRNNNFKVLPLAYGDAAYNSLGVQRYALYNGNEEESLRMDIPVDYTSTLANSIDNFAFQNVGYGQFTGVVPYRPAELMYFSF